MSEGRVTMRRAVTAMVAAGLAGAAMGGAATRALADGAAPAGSKAAIEAIVHDYILAHPEILPEAMARLQARDAATGISAERQALETPFAGAWAGNPKADVTLVMFTDYSCGYCRASGPDIEKLLAEDPKLRVVWREIPILGPQSGVAAQAALAAAKQGQYPAFHRAMFAGGRPDAGRIAAIARTLKLDPARLAADRGGADIRREIDANLALAGKLGVGGTPAFVIGDRMLSGAVGHDALAKAIAEVRHGGPAA